MSEISEEKKKLAQLKKEMELKREKVSAVVKDLIDYCVTNQYNDSLVKGLTSSRKSIGRGSGTKTESKHKVNEPETESWLGYFRIKELFNKSIDSLKICFWDMYEYI